MRIEEAQSENVNLHGNVEGDAGSEKGLLDGSPRPLPGACLHSERYCVVWVEFVLTAAKSEIAR